MIKNNVITATVVVACFFVSPVLHADTETIIQGQNYEQQKLLQEQLLRQETIKQEEPAPVEGVPDPSIMPQDKDSTTFVLQQLVFSSSSIISPEELKEYSSHLLDTEVTLQKLRSFANTLEAYYIQKGYIARVTFPSQKFHNGVVKIRLIEPHVQEVKKAQKPVSKLLAGQNKPPIPAKIPVEYEVKVKEGKTLWYYADIYLGDPLLWPLLLELNPDIDNPDMVVAGETIIVKAKGDGEEIVGMVADIPAEESGASDIESVEMQEKADTDSLPKVLKQLVFTSSDVFSAEELKAFSDHLLNTEITLQKLRLFVTSLEKSYIDKGYIARVILPPQKIHEGAIAIRLIEARVGEVKLTKIKNTNASFIDQRLDAPSGNELLNIHELEKRLININNVYDINLSAQLQPGQKFGSSDILLAVNEPEQHQLNLVLDDNGNESTGEFRQQLVYSNASLTGRRDRLDANIRNSDGSTDGALAYSFYWPASNLRTMLFYAQSEIDITSGPVSDLGVNGDSSVIFIDVSKPIYVTSDRGLTVRTSLDSADSKTRIDDVELEHTSTDTAKVGMGYWRRQGKLYWTTNVALGQHRTHGEFSSTTVRDIEYTTLSGDGFLYYNFGKPYSMQARGNYQFSSEDQLPSAGEFQIGGLGSIRGYDNGVLSGYKGYHLSFELHHNWDTDAWQAGSRMDSFIFLDNGQVDPGDSRRDDNLTSVGFGMNWRMRQGVNFSAAVAWAATQLEEDDEDTSIYLKIDIPLLSLW